MVLISQRSIQAEQLEQENARLRQLLNLRDRLETSAQAAQVLYDTADPYTRRVVVDQGRVAGVELGAPVLDEKGVLGQVTRVHPFVSEVTLLIDRDQAIPVLNIRTGVRGVAYGDPVAGHGGGMELRFMPANADILEGDLLTTSGVDGLYPPGLPVAKVVRVERRADSAFARIYCAPVAGVQGARHVMLLKPAAEPMPERPEPDPVLPGKKGARK
jgi:rod shape-determining protein MreC